MCVGDDHAFAALTEYSRQANERKRLRAYEIVKDVARADRRKLIRVSDQDEARAGLDRAEQGMEQEDVDHRRFVDDEDVFIEEIFLIAEERSVFVVSGVFHFEKAVDRFCFIRRRLAHALCRASRRCRKRALQSEPVEYRYERAYDRRFSGSRTARYYADSAGEGGIYRFLLEIGIFDMRIVFAA